MENNSNLILGKGAYGEVFLKDGNAVKKFDGLRHITQEYAALKYLSNCQHIVNVKNVNFENLQIEMELYDCNLKKWLSNNKKIDIESRNKIIHDILYGLIELHDRGLCHGDLKPGNILIKNDPLKAVLGDCGFVTISKYTKTNLTTKNYRDPVYERTSAHDMFSFGICLYELITNRRLFYKNSYDEYKKIVKKFVENSFYYEIISSLLDEDKLKRPTSKELMSKLFDKKIDTFVPKDIKKYDENISNIEEDMIREIIKVLGHQNKINRCNQGCIAILNFLNKYTIEIDYYTIYTLITLMILSSVFGKPGFNEEKCFLLCSSCKNITKQKFYEILYELLNDVDYISILLLK